MSDRINRLGDRVAKKRAQLFVGRKEELAHLDALCENQNEMRLLFVYGLAGIGKTMFVKECLRRAQLKGHHVTYLDAATLPTTPANLEPRLARILKKEGAGGASEQAPSNQKPPAQTTTGDGPKLLILDSFEHLAGIESWIFQSILTEAPASFRFLLAGRRPPHSRLLADPGWSSVSRLVEMEGFDRPEKLRNNPLLTAPFLKVAGPEQNDLSKRVQLLKDLIYEKASTLKESGRDRVLFDILEKTYFTPAVKQRVVAEELGLSYGTYRRYLSQAVQTLSDRLWRQAEPLL